MRKFLTLFKYEMYKWLVCPSTYIISLIFSLSIGAIFIFLLFSYVKFEQDVPFAQMFFRCYWLPTCILVPLITMRSFSEEYKNGTFQSLFSVPVSYAQVVLAKFLATYLIFLTLWLCSLFLFAAIGFSTGSILYQSAFASDFNIVGGLLFVSITGVFFVSIGIFASSLTENQIVSSMVTFFLLMMSFIGGQFFAGRSKISSLNLFGSYSESLNVFSQLDNFCNGVLDSRVIIFYLTSAVLALCLSTVAIQKKLN